MGNCSLVVAERNVVLVHLGGFVSLSHPCGASSGKKSYVEPLLDKTIVYVSSGASAKQRDCP